MARENSLVEPSFFDKFPQYGHLHRQVIEDLSAIRPTSIAPLEAVATLGNRVLSFARSAGTV